MLGASALPRRPQDGHEPPPEEPDWLLPAAACLALVAGLLVLLIRRRRQEHRIKASLCVNCSPTTTKGALYQALFLGAPKASALAGACQRCGARLQSQEGRLRRKGFAAAAGDQQQVAAGAQEGAHKLAAPCEHPIIFSRSKDSILVPEPGLGSLDSLPAETATTTTRVLTDHKGHSIKIRLASPPPQRQSQLAALHRSVLAAAAAAASSSTNSQVEQVEEPERQLDRASFGSLTSENPLVAAHNGQLAGETSSSCHDDDDQEHDDDEQDESPPEVAHSRSSDCEGPHWDSRQDSSLEQQHQQAPTDGLAGGQEAGPQPLPARPGSSRRSSSATSGGGGGGGGAACPPGPALQLLVRRLSAAAPQQHQTQEEPRPTGGLIGSALSRALGRSSSLSSTGSSSPQAAPENDCFELRPLQVCNLVVAPNGGPAAAAAAASGKPALGSPHQARRASVYGLTVRLFRRQCNELAAPHQEYEELPLIRLAGGGGGQAQEEHLDLRKLAREPESYAFRCARHEFPVRLSLYLVSRRTGARLTLGHCFVAPTDWMRMPGEDELSAGGSSSSSGRPKRLSSESSSSECSSSVAGGSGSNSDDQLLQYQLHQTILEASRQQQQWAPA